MFRIRVCRENNRFEILEITRKWWIMLCKLYPQRTQVAREDRFLPYSLNRIVLCLCVDASISVRLSATVISAKHDNVLKAITIGVNYWVQHTRVLTGRSGSCLVHRHSYEHGLGFAPGRLGDCGLGFGLGCVPRCGRGCDHGYGLGCDHGRCDDGHGLEVEAIFS